MTPATLWIVIAVVAAVVLVALVVGLVLYRRRRISLRESEQVEGGAGTAVAPPRKGNEYKAGGDFSFSAGTDTPPAPPTVRTPAPETAPAPVEPVPARRPWRRPPSNRRPRPSSRTRSPPLPPSTSRRRTIRPATGRPRPPPPRRSHRPRAAWSGCADGLARSRSGFGQSLLGLLGAGELDEESWEDVEATLLAADLGPEMTADLIDTLRTELAARAVRTPEQAKAAAARGAHRRPAHRHGPLGAGAPARRPARGAAGRRRERHRQDHHHRQARPGAGRRRPARRARRRRHVPRRRRRAARHLGRAGRRRPWSAARRVPTRPPSRSTP